MVPFGRGAAGGIFENSSNTLHRQILVNAAENIPRAVLIQNAFFHFKPLPACDPIGSQTKQIEQLLLTKLYKLSLKLVVCCV